MKSLILPILLLFIIHSANAQQFKLGGAVKIEGVNKKATVYLAEQKKLISTDSLGRFEFSDLKAGVYNLKISQLEYKTVSMRIDLLADTALAQIILDPLDERLNEVVITGTQKEVSRLESPVPVEIYTAKFFRKNPTPSIFEALQNVNGVRPQLNCNICNTGDIHINGLEGPYTMVLIDGMPIVSSLSTVYGLSGIPNALVERIEVVKGPASSLYGSEAVGGLINIITKKVQNSSLFSGI